MKLSRGEEGDVVAFILLISYVSNVAQSFLFLETLRFVRERLKKAADFGKHEVCATPLATLSPREKGVS
ncbi:MAG: hypothetical protein ACRD2G_05090 [Terriglobia bacterium]